ncbi:YfhO family protein [Litchfieldia salsa]|uniref:Uncharacterized membrane protein YfhO n=1 Tax=Litchfieldia salsa TaxID=930152 RepID=A0A1H0VKQ0_9BACI|nr:YfhO family protein [Litchfieldia salsa]SDP78871.1 Uncharacterized membrane protein YfhO [Litchfieldia salsa]
MDKRKSKHLILLKQIKKSPPIFNLFVCSITIAFLSHLFFISEWLDGRYMTGINDGLSQMQPFKQLLYTQYKEGQFFYSPDFGLGGGTYTQLGYYFATSIVFLITVGVTLILETLGVINEPDIFYWADVILVISVIRMTAILMITTYYFRYLRISSVPAFVGAVVYSTSIIYFRHVTYWEFFADAMIFLPLLLIGIERIMREGKVAVFLVAVSLSFFDNFYFAYVNFLLMGIYILFRWMIPLSEGELKKSKQIKLYLINGVTGFLIGGVVFVPSVYGFLNNYRPSFEDHIPVFEFVDNILLNGRVVYIPVFVLLSLFLFTFYKNKLFRFFAVTTMILIVMHFSPLVGSVFNGFSAPQYRWEYFLALTAGGLTAATLPKLLLLKKKQLVLPIFLTTSLYFLFYRFDPKLNFKEFSDGYLAITAIFTILFVVVLIMFKNQRIEVVMSFLIILTSIINANFFQENRLTNTGTEFRVSKEYMMSDEYNGADQQELVRMLTEQEKDPLARIDWMVPLRNNTPIVQKFKGTSVYSSILNKELLLFYLQDLEIDMKRESVSRYGSFGDRANLSSLFMGKYFIAKRDDKAVPYGYREILSSGDYVAYENDHLLPFIRTTNTIFQENDLKNTSPLAKEQAMLEGIVLEEENSNEDIPKSENLIEYTRIEKVNSSYEKGVLKIKEEEGGIDLVVNHLNPSAKDYYLKFYFEGLSNKEEFFLKVNEYITVRKEVGSIYRTNVNEIVVRIKANERISIRLPKGSYHLRDFELYEETYEVLERVKEKSKKEPFTHVTWSGNRLSFTYQNDHNKQYAAIPLPYEKGWRLSVNGEPRKILKANYAFTGIELIDGENQVEFVYYPPFFFPLLFISVLTIITSVFIIKRKKAVPK